VKPAFKVDGDAPKTTEKRRSFPSLVSKTSPAAQTWGASEDVAIVAAASRERKKVVFVMVWVFGMSNVPSVGRSSTFEYRKRKKPRVPFSVAKSFRRIRQTAPIRNKDGLGIMGRRDR
jgi:hypothetical protein